MESFIHLNIERSVNQPSPPAEYFLESAIYAITHFFFQFLSLAQTFPAAYSCISFHRLSVQLILSKI